MREIKLRNGLYQDSKGNPVDVHDELDYYIASIPDTATDCGIYTEYEETIDPSISSVLDILVYVVDGKIHWINPAIETGWMIIDEDLTNKSKNGIKIIR